MIEISSSPTITPLERSLTSPQNSPHTAISTKSTPASPPIALGPSDSTDQEPISSTDPAGPLKQGDCSSNPGSPLPTRQQRECRPPTHLRDYVCHAIDSHTPNPCPSTPHSLTHFIAYDKFSTSRRAYLAPPPLGMSLDISLI